MKKVQYFIISLMSLLNWFTTDIYKYRELSLRISNKFSKVNQLKKENSKEGLFPNLLLLASKQKHQKLKGDIFSLQNKFFNEEF